MVLTHGKLMDMSSKQIIQIGFNKAVYWLAWTLGYRISCFIDADPYCPNRYEHIVVAPERHINPDYEIVLMAIADGEQRKQAVVQLNEHVPGIEYLTLPAITYNPSIHVGKGAIIFPGVYIGHDTKIGDFNIIEPNVIIGNNVMTSDYLNLNKDIENETWLTEDGVCEAWAEVGENNNYNTKPVE